MSQFCHIAGVCRPTSRQAAVQQYILIQKYMQASPFVQGSKLKRQTQNHYAEQAIADPHKQTAMVSQSSYKTQSLLHLTFAFVGVLVTHNLCSLESSILCEGLGQNVIIDLIAHVTHKYPEVIFSPF